MGRRGQIRRGRNHHSCHHAIRARGLAGLSAQSGGLLRQGGSHHLVKLIAKPILRQIADRRIVLQDIQAYLLLYASRHQNNRQGRLVGSHRLDHLQPVEARHIEVGNDKVGLVHPPAV